MIGDLLLRRVRGIIGTAIIWALAWLPVGVLDVVWRNWRPVYCFYCQPALSVLAGWMGWGALSGAVFAVVLMIAEQKQSLGQLSIARTAAWGAIGALAAPVAITIADVTQSGGYTDWTFTAVALGLSGALGAACAGGTLALARRGSR